MTTIEVLQTNSNHCSAAHALLAQEAESQQIDVLIISEPLLAPHMNSAANIPNFQKITQSRTAIYLRRGITYQKIPTSNEVCAIKIDHTTLISCYASPNKDIDGVLNELDRLIHLSKGPLLIGGDLNVGLQPLVPAETLPHRKKARSMAAQAFIEKHGLIIENKKVATCTHQGRQTINDYTLSQDVTLRNWRVSEKESLSDHKYIRYNICNITTPSTHKHFSKRQTDTKRFQKAILRQPELLPYNSPKNTERNATTITNWLTKTILACTVVVPNQQQTYWWNETLQNTKQKLKTLQRRRHRAGDQTRAKLTEDIRILKRAYIKQILQAKENAWKTFVTRATAWGKPYKLIVKEKHDSCIPQRMKTPEGTIIDEPHTIATALLHEKFPRRSTILEYSRQTEETAIPPQDCVSTSEIADILRKQNNKSAPGSDNVRYKHLKILHKRTPNILTELYNGCLQHSCFPISWKKGKVVFLHKPGKPKDEISSYRPITLLSAVGKILEQLIAVRIKRRIRISMNQYGFLKKKSTEQCIREVISEIQTLSSNNNFVALLSLDIKGAFDHLEHQAILRSCSEASLPTYLTSITSDYFCNRLVTYNTAIQASDRGCPQGSVLGPLFWILSFDKTLQHITQSGHSVFAYADDTAVIIEAHTYSQLANKVTNVLTKISSRLKEDGLELNLQKTEMLVFITAPKYTIGMPDYTPDPIKIGNHVITPTKKLKYLGIIIDDSLNFTNHIEYIAAKAIKSIQRLKMVCRNLFGYGTIARKIMVAGLVGNILQYASTAFAHRLLLFKNRDKINTVDRICNIVIGRCYCTVPYITSTIIANRPPMVLQIFRRTMLMQHKNDWPINYDLLPGVTTLPEKYKDAAIILNDAVHQKWQRMWTQYNKWPREIVKEIPKILKPNFWLSQGLTGHGAFLAYLNRIGKTQEHSCTCDKVTPQTAKHIIMACPRYVKDRPTAWNLNDESTCRYIENTVKSVWVENDKPNQTRPSQQS